MKKSLNYLEEFSACLNAFPVWLNRVSDELVVGLSSAKVSSLLSDPKSRSCVCSLFVTLSLICGVYFIGSSWVGKDYFKLSPVIRQNVTQRSSDSDKCKPSPKLDILPDDTRQNESSRQNEPSEQCHQKCIPSGSESLPTGIVSKTSNLEMQPLWGPVTNENKSKRTRNLLAIAVGIKQKSLVNQIVKKFFADDFVVMLFHYDKAVNEWDDFEWSNSVIHVSASNQTKWWFAKRFLHPDIIAEYDYIFLWDEDLGVENFNPQRYLSIIKEEGLEISQPALDSSRSEVHHQITVRRNRSKVHRRYYRSKGGRECYGNSTAPPCVGWVEMMAPVFSRAAWRCVWYMIQNDLIHAWGLDMQLGYCAQGDRTVKVGVVDEQYIVHLGLPTLGGVATKDKINTELSDQSSTSKNSSESNQSATSPKRQYDNRTAVRLRSYKEMAIFKNRWNKAVKEDQCWVDPFVQPAEQKHN